MNLDLFTNCLVCVWCDVQQRYFVTQRRKGIRIFLSFFRFFFHIFLRDCNTNTKKNERITRTIPTDRRMTAQKATPRDVCAHTQALTQTMRGHMFSINLAIQSIFLFYHFHNMMRKSSSKLRIFINFDSRFKHRAHMHWSKSYKNCCLFEKYHIILFMNHLTRHTLTRQERINHFYWLQMKCMWYRIFFVLIC